METKRLCKWCEMRVQEVCSHLQCVQANRRGFCSIGCQQAYYANMKPVGDQFGRLVHERLA